MSIPVPMNTGQATDRADGPPAHDVTLNRLMTTLDSSGEGARIYDLIAQLYPICRSLTGEGVRQTLRVLEEYVALQVHEVPSGTPVFDWTVPREWNIRDAYVKNSQGERVIDFARSNLHVVGYSTPVHEWMSRELLRKHLFTLPDRPDWIPYRTSYYSEQWGFCISHRQFEQLPDDRYEVCIDSTLSDGSLTYGEYVVPGRSSEEVLISTHICHPSLCNDNLSGVALAACLAQSLSGLSLNYSYRFLFIPGTIGSITWLARNEANVSRIKHGLVLSCVGDRGGLFYKKSRQGNAEIDRTAAHVLRRSGTPHQIRDFSPWGYDERQYCSPGFNLPVGLLSRTPYGEFPEYHTSADDLTFVSAEALADSYQRCLEIFRILEENRKYINRSPKGEPQLGKRGLYLPVGTSGSGAEGMAMLWVLNQSDGDHSLLDIAERSGLDFPMLQHSAGVLAEHGLLEDPNATPVPAAAPVAVPAPVLKRRGVPSWALAIGARRAAAVVLLLIAMGALLYPNSPTNVGLLYPSNPTFVVAPGASGRELFIATDGRPTNNGSREQPYDIATVFGNPTLVHPGDTVWLRGGTYRVAVTSQLTGEPDAPIVVRQYPNERVILDAASRTESALTVRGSDTWFWGFEVTDSYPARITASPTYTTGLRMTSVSVFGPRTKFINMTVHDGEQGFALWSAAEDAEMYGNLIYNVGFEAGDRGHGHSIYVQSEKGSKRIVDNILWGGHSFGVHAYTEGGFIDNIYLEGNIAFNHGLLSKSGPTTSFLFRSKNAPPQNPTLVRNYSYYPAARSGRGVDITTPVPAAKGCTNAVIEGNYLAAPALALAMTCQSIRSIRGNTIIGNVLGVAPTNYPNNTYLGGRPTGTQVFVRPNLYERGRAAVAIYNWDMTSAVDVSLRGTGLEAGEHFEVRDAQNYFGKPVASGVYSPWQSVAVPMTGLQVVAPVGEVAVKPSHTAPEFGAFVVVPVPTRDTRVK